MNIELAHRVLKEIETHPASWYQGAWAVSHECGTAYCFAGLTVVLSGYSLKWGQNRHGEKQADYCYLDDPSQFFPIGAMAANLLNICECDADLLFRGSNSLECIKGILAELESKTT